MDRDLQAKIEAAFDDLINARKRLLEDKEATQQAKETLKDTEAQYINGGYYTASGKNEAERGAAMRISTKVDRVKVSGCESQERSATLVLEIALDARRNLESMLRIEELEAA